MKNLILVLLFPIGAGLGVLIALLAEPSFAHHRALQIEEDRCGRPLTQICSDFSGDYEAREDAAELAFKNRGLRSVGVHFGDSWCEREACDQTKR